MDRGGGGGDEEDLHDLCHGRQARTPSLSVIGTSTGVPQRRSSSPEVPHNKQDLAFTYPGPNRKRNAQARIGRNGSRKSVQHK